jgi:hypothetical protein
MQKLVAFATNLMAQSLGARIFHGFLEQRLKGALNLFGSLVT